MEFEFRGAWHFSGRAFGQRAGASPLSNAACVRKDSVLKQSLPNYIGTVGGGLTLLALAKVWTLSQNGYSFALSHLGLYWTLAGSLGLILLLLWGGMLAYGRFRPQSFDPLEEPLAPYVLAARPYVAVSLRSGEGGPSGDFLNGEIKNTNGTAVGVHLVLPGLPIQQFDTLEAGRPQTLRYSWNKDTPDDFTGVALIEYTDTFGNVFQQESRVTTPVLANGVAHGYSLAPFGPPKRTSVYTQ